MIPRLSIIILLHEMNASNDDFPLVVTLVFIGKIS